MWQLSSNIAIKAPLNGLTQPGKLKSEICYQLVFIFISDGIEVH